MLLTDLESDRAERKEGAANSDRLSEAICAFANDMPGCGEPGVLFVGVSDNGAVLRRPITDELLRHLADLRDQGTILPPPMMTVRKLRANGGEVAVVEVLPSAAPPVRFKGRVYIRVGPRRAIASLDEERRLNERRRSLDLPFDSRPISGASLTDLDEYAFTSVLLPVLLPHDVLAENERSTGCSPTSDTASSPPILTRRQISRPPFSTTKRSSNCGTALSLARSGRRSAHSSMTREGSVRSRRLRPLTSGSRCYPETSRYPGSRMI